MVAVDSVPDDPSSNDTENSLDIETVRLDKSTSTQSSIEEIEIDVSLKYRFILPAILFSFVMQNIEK